MPRVRLSALADVRRQLGGLLADHIAAHAITEAPPYALRHGVDHLLEVGDTVTAKDVMCSLAFVATLRRQPDRAAALARYWHALGGLGGFLPAYGEALEASGEAGAERRARFVATDALANALTDAGAYAEALPFADAALSEAKAQHGDAHPTTASTLRLVGTLRGLLGDLDTAEALLAHADATLMRTLGPDHPERASALHNRALVAERQGRLDDARALYEEALAIHEATRGLGHLETLRTSDSLAGVLVRLGDLDSARTRFEETLTQKRRRLGPGHPSTATTLQNLAGVLGRQGDLSGAERCFRGALGAWSSALGPAHPHVAVVRGNLGRLLAMGGRWEDALEQIANAADILRAALGEDHPDTLRMGQLLSHVETKATKA